MQSLRVVSSLYFTPFKYSIIFHSRKRSGYNVLYRFLLCCFVLSTNIIWKWFTQKVRERKKFNNNRVTITADRSNEWQWNQMTYTNCTFVYLIWSFWCLRYNTHKKKRLGLEWTTFSILTCVAHVNIMPLFERKVRNVYETKAIWLIGMHKFIWSEIGFSSFIKLSHLFLHHTSAADVCARLSVSLCQDDYLFCRKKVNLHDREQLKPTILTCAQHTCGSEDVFNYLMYFIYEVMKV